MISSYFITRSWYNYRLRLVLRALRQNERLLPFAHLHPSVRLHAAPRFLVRQWDALILRRYDLLADERSAFLDLTIYLVRDIIRLNALGRRILEDWEGPQNSTGQAQQEQEQGQQAQERGQQERGQAQHLQQA